MRNKENLRREKGRKSGRKNTIRQHILALFLFACLVIPGLILPHYFLENAEKEIYGDYLIAREDTPIPFGSESDFHSNLIDCLSRENGDTKLYKLTDSDLTKEEILELAEGILKDELGVYPLELNSAYVYGNYDDMGLWQLEWTASDDSTIYMSMEAESGMLLRLECQRRRQLNGETILHFLDYYADWQIYYSNQPSREETKSNAYAQKLWLSNQDIGLVITENLGDNGIWQFSLQLFHSTA